MMRILALIFGLVLTASNASASIVQVTYTGTVIAGSDSTGLFGTVNTGVSAYVGETFVATYIFDTSLATGIFSKTSPDQNYVHGGDDFFNLSPATSASLTVHGHTFSFNPVSYSQLSGTGPSVGWNMQTAYARNHFHDTVLDSYIRANDSGPYTVPVSISGNFVYHVLPGQTAIGSFITQGTYVTASLDTLTISGLAPPVPEASTWAMMVLGFACLGLVASRRKKLMSADRAACA